ncbi:rhomboid family intramembrane serine protease [Sphingobacterium sp. SRCM116780]|uniref:rhomboid family intramembrane serine protease n=1 Tax=Sphingobacterium sp. SRCM116780 TaxID=2907623 RepID=UPI001F35A332|nr:rhomboid family intramembrane serine protease [Sphingobacterium sp. SRCM116780]UIR54795.1 rhomboid family intramembrane serine protease [Sphingobacterium sp. SRCM116780]
MHFFDIFPTFEEAPYSYIIVPIIMISSVIGFYYKPYFHALILHPYEIARRKRIHTLLTSACIHRNLLHLLFNALIIYGLGYDMFGNIMQVYGTLTAYVLTPLLFFLLISLPNLFQTFQKRNDFYFTSMGASGLAFGLYGFSALFFPLQPMKSTIFSFVTNSVQLWFCGLLILILLAQIKKTKINKYLHLSAYLTGAVLSIVIRPQSIIEVYNFIFN